MTDILLYIATDDPVFAAMEVLRCHPAEVPLWARLVSDPKKIMALPRGAKCIGIFASMRPRLSLAHCAWIERCERGGLDRGLTADEFDMFREWTRQGQALGAPQCDRTTTPAALDPPAHPPTEPPLKPKQSRWK